MSFDKFGFYAVAFSLFLLNAANAEDQLITAPAEAPMYSLSGIKQERDRFGRPSIVIDYVRTRNGTGMASIGARGKDGSQQMVGTLPNQDAGKIQLSSFFSAFGDATQDVEVYLFTNVYWAESFSGNCLISNTVRMGNPAGSTTARAWTAEETAAYEKHKTGLKPPASLPTGYVAVNIDTKLVPGVPVMIGRFGEWVESEIVRVDKPTAAVHLVGTDRNVRTQLNGGWLAIKKENLRAIEDNPKQFSTKIRLARNSLIALPDGIIELPDSVQLIEGMPVHIDRSGKWTEGFVLSTTGIHVSTTDRHFENWPYGREDLAIAESSIAKLTDPTVIAEYKKRANALNASSSQRGITGRTRRTCNYPISIAIAPKHRVLPAELKLEEGTVLYACWGRKWYEVYARGDNGDGTIHIHWKDWDSDNWDCNIARSNLAIADATIKKLKASTKTKLGNDNEDSEDEESGIADEGENANELRSWSDKTGKFKVQAKLLKRTKDEVILLTEAGKQMKVKIDKLAKECQDFINTIPEDAENPFAE